MLRPGTQAAAEPPQATPPDARSEAAFRERKVKAAANDEKLQQASLEGKRRAAECAKEQARVLLLMQPRRLAQQDAQGQPIVLDDDARQRERARSEKFVAENCTPP